MQARSYISEVWQFSSWLAWRQFLCILETVLAIKRRTNGVERVAHGLEGGGFQLTRRGVIEVSADAPQGGCQRPTKLRAKSGEQSP